MILLYGIISIIISVINVRPITAMRPGPVAVLGLPYLLSPLLSQLLLVLGLL